MTPPAGTQSLWRTFRIPVVLAISSTVGLISALVGDSGYDILSWGTLALPLLAIYLALRRPPPARRAPGH